MSFNCDPWAGRKPVKGWISPSRVFGGSVTTWSRKLSANPTLIASWFPLELVNGDPQFEIVYAADEMFNRDWDSHYFSRINVCYRMTNPVVGRGEPLTVARLAYFDPVHVLPLATL